MTEGATADTGRADGVWVVSADAVLAAAIAAGLSVLGWPVVRLVTEAHLLAAALAGARVTRLVLVADAAGYLPDPRAALVHLPAPLVVAVGARLAWPALLAAVERLVAVAVVDADQPVGDLLRSLDRVLGGTAGPAPAGLAAALREREHEARRFAALTPREQWTLGQLIAGLSAAEIASREQVALATVRSHIRSVLAKLGVSSQVAAVALAHRSARELPIVERIREVHQF